MSQQRKLAVAILAAGQGKRMGNPNIAKVLAPLCGKPLLGYVLEQSSELHPIAIVVIIGHQRDAVNTYVRSIAPNAECVVQDKQLGTGHAVQQTAPVLANQNVDVIILSGDVPLLSTTTLLALVNRHQTSGAVATVLSAQVPNPAGYGRVVRDEHGVLLRIVEHKDATENELFISEINSGIYVVQSTHLFAALDRVENGNVQGEFYLTDIIGILQHDGLLVDAWCGPVWEELHGINTTDDLVRATQILEERSLA